jgi:Tfp pilus assembly protein PilX
MQVSGLKNSNGAVLISVLVFLFVLTLMMVSNSQDVIINQKMQNAMRHDFAVFLRAEAGMQQAILSLQGESVDLPDSPIVLRTTVQKIKIDRCGNQIVEILSIAQDDHDKVMLNSRDIFARVPVAKHCQKIPVHRCLWWRIQNDV